MHRRIEAHAFAHASARRGQCWRARGCRDAQPCRAETPYHLRPDLEGLDRNPGKSPPGRRSSRELTAATARWCLEATTGEQGPSGPHLGKRTAALQPFSGAEAVVFLNTGYPFEDDLRRIGKAHRELLFELGNGLATGNDATTIGAERDPRATVPGE